MLHWWTRKLPVFVFTSAEGRGQRLRLHPGCVHHHNLSRCLLVERRAAAVGGSGRKSKGEMQPLPQSYNSTEYDFISVARSNTLSIYIMFTAAPVSSNMLQKKNCLFPAATMTIHLIKVISCGCFMPFHCSLVSMNQPCAISRHLFTPQLLFETVFVFSWKSPLTYELVEFLFCGKLSCAVIVTKPEQTETPYTISSFRIENPRQRTSNRRNHALSDVVSGKCGTKIPQWRWKQTQLLLVLGNALQFKSQINVFNHV